MTLTFELAAWLLGWGCILLGFSMMSQEYRRMHLSEGGEAFYCIIFFITGVMASGSITVVIAITYAMIVAGVVKFIVIATRPQR